MTKRRGRPRSSDRVQLNLRLSKKTIEIMKAIALREGYITYIGIHKGEPNISRWLDDKFGAEYD